MKTQSPLPVPPPPDKKGLAEGRPVDPTETLKLPLPDPSETAIVLRDPETAAASSGTSTMIVPGKEPDQTKTADIAPALLPGSKSATPASPGPGTPMAGAAPAASGGSLKAWLGLAACLLIAGGLAAYWFLRPARRADSASETPAQTAPEAVPPELRSYLDQAKGGDAKAMHMMALMYWNGLNVRQDRVKGLAWYRKAAAAGDPAAQKELSVIEAQ